MKSVTEDAEVYVRSFPVPGAAIPISGGAATYPLWSADGTRLFYGALAGRRFAVIAARIAQSPSSRIVSRDTLVILSADELVGAGFAVFPDTKRVAYASPVSNSFQILVAPNWRTEMHRRLAAAGGDGNGDAGGGR